jgi:hypothetical protein
LYADIERKTDDLDLSDQGDSKNFGNEFQAKLLTEPIAKLKATLNDFLFQQENKNKEGKTKQ